MYQLVKKGVVSVMIILPLAWVFAFIGTINSSEWLSQGVFLRQSSQDDLRFCRSGFVCRTYKQTQGLKYKTADAL